MMPGQDYRGNMPEGGDMRKALACTLLFTVAAGCTTIRPARLEKGMTVTQVSMAFKREPEAVYSKKINGNTVEVVDYSEESLCIPNPIDDYWCLLPQTTRVIRVWFLDGKAQEWYMTRCASYEGVCKLEGRPEWSTPPDFESPAAPAFVRNIRVQKK